MRLFDIVTELLASGEKTVNLGRLNPSDLEGILRAKQHVDDVRRKDPGKLQELLASHGFRTYDELEDATDYIQASLARSDPGYSQKVTEILHRLSLEDMQATHGISVGDPSSERIDGVSLQELARVHAALQKVDARNAAAKMQTIAAHGVDPQRYDAADAGWRRRMDARRDPITAGAVMNLYMTLLVQFGGTFDQAAMMELYGLA